VTCLASREEFKQEAFREEQDDAAFLVGLGHARQTMPGDGWSIAKGCNGGQKDRDRPTREIHASRAALVPKPYRAVISRDTARRLIASRRIRSSSADRDEVIS
jgi:hypothetical protein